MHPFSKPPSKNTPSRISFATSNKIETIQKDIQSHKKPKHKHNHKQASYIHPQTTTPTSTSTTTTASSSPNITFQPNTTIKGLKFGGQFIVKSFTVRRARPLELSLLLNLSPPQPFPSTITFLPSNFTILAHHAWHTLTLGLGTKKSKVIIFVFDTESSKSSIDRSWCFSDIALGDVNKKLIRGMVGWELARFKFRKGCITFYVFAVRKSGGGGGVFQCGDDLRMILHSVVSLKDFLDHTAMLALPNQRSLDRSSSTNHHNNHNNHNTTTTHSVAAH